jgi:hypothetical protein
MNVWRCTEAHFVLTLCCPGATLGGGNGEYEEKGMNDG